jgi:prefoldin alpha subunit
MTKKDDAKKEEAYLMLQMIDAQMRELDRELRAIESKGYELIRLKDSLDTLGQAEGEMKSYSLVGSGIYARSEFKRTGSVLVNVGANVFVEKDIKDAQKLITSQIGESNAIALQINQNLQMLSAKAQEIQQGLIKNV